jgi:signal transduction histidine kinase
VDLEGTVVSVSGHGTAVGYASPAQVGRPSHKRTEQELAECRERLRALTLELSTADERARRRLSVGVHDHIGQALAGARLKVEALIDDAGPARPRLAADLCEVRALIDEAIRGTRSLTFELSAPVVLELGLEAALETVGRETMAEHGVTFTFRTEGTPRRLPRDTEVVVYRTIRELLHNIVKYAHATRSAVTMRYTGQETLVELADDGRGFDPERVGGFGRHGGFGLISIREQLRQLGGRLRIDSTQGHGTRVEVGIPW